MQSVEMTMRTIHRAAAAIAITALTASPALAGTRPGDKPTIYAPPPQSSADPKKTDVGPRNGFPDTPGLDRARERASDNAAFNRSKSNGT